MRVAVVAAAVAIVVDAAGDGNCDFARKDGEGRGDWRKRQR